MASPTDSQPGRLSVLASRLLQILRPSSLGTVVLVGMLLLPPPLDASTPSNIAPPTVVLPHDPQELLFGAKIPRTMALLSTSNRTRRHPVKILVYGQSISAGMKRSALEDELRKRFPHAELTFENRSISGFSAPQLARSAAVDLPLAYPDLIIFHDYGQNAIEYERMLADIRRRTTSEIMIWTDHYGNAGVPGDDEYQARAAREEEASDIVRALAMKYDCELVDARPIWKAYLEANRLAAKDLLSDNVHLNDHGRALMTAIILRHFRLHPQASRPWMTTVRSFEAKRQPDDGAVDEIVYTGTPWKIRGNDAIGHNDQGALKLTFVGNRIDLIPGAAVPGAQLGSAKILIDGLPPSMHPELYAFTLPSPAFGADYQPGIRRVTRRAPLLLENWTLKITEAGEEHFAFEVHGSKTGFDGHGRVDLGKLERGAFGVLNFASPEGGLPDFFVSNSGRVVLDHRDFKVFWGQERAKQLSPIGWEIKWSVVPQFLDVYQALAPEDPALLKTITVAQGLSNSEHTLEIIPSGDGLVPIREIIVHRPPLQ